MHGTGHRWALRGALSLILFAAYSPAPVEPVLFEVPCSIDATLTQDLLREELPATAREVRAWWAAEDRLEIVTESEPNRGGYVTRVRIQVGFRTAEPPRVMMSSVVVDPDHPGYSWPHETMRGEVVVNTDGSDLLRAGEGPFLLTYRAVGWCSGSDVRRDGFVVVEPADIEHEPAERPR